GIRYKVGTPARAQSSETWTSGMPSAFGSSTFTGYQYSVYCSYIPEEVSKTSNFGISEVFSLSTTSANRRAQLVTFNESGEIQSISIYHNGGTGRMLLGVYSDN